MRTGITLAMIAAVCVLVAACGSKSDKPSGNVEMGRKYFSQQGCTLCHGEDAGGKNMAPALRNLSQHYTRETLIKYLEDPMEYTKTDQRLQEQAPKYAGAMPGYANLGPEKLSALADFLMSL